jgi:rhodanese-related sulfurtransferase
VAHKNRPWLGIPTFLGLALVCAWVSNALAGPARRLSWFPREVPAAGRPAPATVPAPVMATSAVTSRATDTAPGAGAPSNPAGSHPSRPNPAAARPDSTEGLLTRFPPLVDTPQGEISSAEALWLHGRGALFLDARRSAIFALGHIPGARCLPAWEDGLTEKVEQLALFCADLKAPVVVYCSGGDCQDSHLLAQKLWLAGFRNLRLYTDGFPDWQAKGRPITQGDRP